MLRWASGPAHAPPRLTCSATSSAHSLTVLPHSPRLTHLLPYSLTHLLLLLDSAPPAASPLPTQPSSADEHLTSLPHSLTLNSRGDVGVLVQEGEPLTHSLTHSLTHPLTHYLTHELLLLFIMYCRSQFPTS